MDFFESVLSETSTFSPPDPGSGYLKRKNRVLFLRSGKAFVKTSTHITTLDNFIQQHNLSRIDILKIDVEGFELQVIQGAVKILRSGMVGIVQFERHVDDMRQDTYPVIQELLSSLNFRKLREIKHPIGNFYEVLYQSNNSSFLTNE